MPVLDKERFNALVETEGWTLSTLSEFVGLYPRDLLSPKGIDVHTTELLGYLMNASVGYLLGTEEYKGAPEVDISLFGNFKAQPFTKEVDESCYEYAAKDLGMPIDIFNKIMEGKLGMPMKLTCRFNSVMASYNKPKRLMEQPQMLSVGYQQAPIPMYQRYPMPVMTPEDKMLVQEIMSIVPKISACNSLTAVIRYCKAYRKVRAIELEINK